MNIKIKTNSKIWEKKLCGVIINFYLCITMKITEQLPDGSYITYENFSEYMSGCIYKYFGCSGCLIVLLIIIGAVVEFISLFVSE